MTDVPWSPQSLAPFPSHRLGPLPETPNWVRVVVTWFAEIIASPPATVETLHVVENWWW